MEGKDKERRDIDIRIAQLEDSKQKDTISDKETKELLELTLKKTDYRNPTPIAKEIRDYSGQVVTLPARGGDVKAIETRGAKLFKEKGSPSLAMSMREPRLAVSQTAGRSRDTPSTVLICRGWPPKSHQK